MHVHGGRLPTAQAGMGGAGLSGGVCAMSWLGLPAVQQCFWAGDCCTAGGAAQTWSWLPRCSILADSVMVHEAEVSERNKRAV